MPIKITTLENPQQIEAVVSGPDGANRLYVLTGIAPVGVAASPGVTQTEIFTFLIGPTLTRQQFVKAIATASLSFVNLNSLSLPVTGYWSVRSVDADWDDESGQVEVRVEVQVSASVGGIFWVRGIGYQATILAQL